MPLIGIGNEASKQGIIISQGDAADLIGSVSKLGGAIGTLFGAGGTALGTGIGAIVGGLAQVFGIGGSANKVDAPLLYRTLLAEAFGQSLGPDKVFVDASGIPHLRGTYSGDDLIVAVNGVLGELLRKFRPGDDDYFDVAIAAASTHISTTGATADGGAVLLIFNEDALINSGGNGNAGGSSVLSGAGLGIVALAALFFAE